MDKAFADQAVSNAFCPERLKRAIRLANWFHEELAGMLAADLGYRSRGTLERIINWIKGFKGAMVSQGDITDNNIGIDRLRTIWSLYPNYFVGWKSFSDRGRPAMYMGAASI